MLFQAIIFLVNHLDSARDFQKAKETRIYIGGRGPLLGRYGPALYLDILNRDGPDRNGMRVSIPIRHENAVIFGRLMEFPLGSAGSRRRGRKLPFRPVN